MWRVTLLVDDVDTTPADMVRMRVPLTDSRGPLYFAVPSDRVLAVENVPEPLPTEPGVKFRASYRGDAPCWWFSQRSSTGSLVFRPVDEPADEHGLYVYDPTESLLRRLADPDVTP